MIRNKEEEKKVLESISALFSHKFLDEIRLKNLEGVDLNRELGTLRARFTSRKDHGIKKFNSIISEAKMPGKIDTQNPLTLKLIKEMGEAKEGMYIVNKTSMGLYLF